MNNLFVKLCFVERAKQRHEQSVKLCFLLASVSLCWESSMYSIKFVFLPLEGLRVVNFQCVDCFKLVYVHSVTVLIGSYVFFHALEMSFATHAHTHNILTNTNRANTRKQNIIRPEREGKVWF